MIATTLPGLDIRPIHWGNRGAEAEFAVKQTRGANRDGAGRLGTTFGGRLRTPLPTSVSLKGEDGPCPRAESQHIGKNFVATETLPGSRMGPDRMKAVQFRNPATQYVGGIAPE